MSFYSALVGEVCLLGGMICLYIWWLPELKFICLYGTFLGLKGVAMLKQGPAYVPQRGLELLRYILLPTTLLKGLRKGDVGRILQRFSNAGVWFVGKE